LLARTRARARALSCAAAMRASAPAALAGRGGKQAYQFSERVRFGDLPQAERKAINKVVLRQSGLDHTHICNGEIGGMLACFEAHAWDTAPCLPQIEAMYACVEMHRADPDPKLLVSKWQKQIRGAVMQSFAKAHKR